MSGVLIVPCSGFAVLFYTGMQCNTACCSRYIASQSAYRYIYTAYQSSLNASEACGLQGQGLEDSH